MGGEIRRFRVADRDRAVSVHQKHSHRLADYVAPAEHRAFFTGDLDFIPLQQFHNACRSAGQQVDLEAVVVEDVVVFRHHVGRRLAVARVDQPGQRLAGRRLRQRRDRLIGECQLGIGAAAGAACCPPAGAAC